LVFADALHAVDPAKVGDARDPGLERRPVETKSKPITGASAQPAASQPINSPSEELKPSDSSAESIEVVRRATPAPTLGMEEHESGEIRTEKPEKKSLK